MRFVQVRTPHSLWLMIESLKSLRHPCISQERLDGSNGNILLMWSALLRCEANHLAEVMASLASSNQDLYNLSIWMQIIADMIWWSEIFFVMSAWISDSFQGLLAKSLESMLLLWEQHVNAIPDADDSEPASRLRSTANVSWLQIHRIWSTRTHLTDRTISNHSTMIFPTISLPKQCGPCQPVNILHCMYATWHMFGLLFLQWLWTHKMLESISGVVPHFPQLWVYIVLTSVAGPRCIISYHHCKEST